MNYQFNLSQIVFLITDKEQDERMVVGVFIEPNGVSYKLACGATTSWHNEIEISSSKNILKTFE